MQNQKLDLAVATGIYTAFYDIEATDVNTGVSEEDDGTAPVPLIGLRGAYLINDRWMAKAYTDYLTIDNSDVDATYLDSTVSVEYRPWERTSIGIAYNLVNIEAEDKSSDDEADFEYSGFLLYLSYTFK